MRRYALSVAVVLAAIAIRAAFDPVFGARYAFLIFVLAITAAGWFGGFGPGALATVLSAGSAAVVWLPPPGFAVVGLADRVAFGVFLVIGLSVSAAMESLHRARRRAERTEDDLRRISDAVPPLIAYIGADRRFRFVNQPYAARHRRVRAAVIGAAVPDVLGAERYARMRPHLDAALGGTKVSFELLMPYEEEPHEQLVTYVPDRADDGTVRGAIVVITDLTHTKAAERERAQLLVRTEEARAAAEAANRSKDEFLAVLSHELRTPLTSMLGWARLLRTPNLPASRLAHGLDVIERNTRLQARLISDLLDISRIVAGKLQVERHEVELVATVEAALESLQGEIEAKGITISRWLDPAASRMLGDGTRLQQIVVNLLSNAVKFTPSGGAVTIQLVADQDRARLSVSDTGVGIAPDVLPNVFDRFLQARTPSNRGSGGLGLGLAIVRHLVELHGGRVWAESPGLDQGATFTVELPLLTERRAATDARGPLDRAPHLDGLHVLLVEDDVDAREMLRIILVGAGATVTTADTVDAALEAAATDPPGLVVSDIGLPGRDGYDLVRAMREGEARRGERPVPAIALTAFAAVEDRQRAFAAGFQFHLPKPVDPGHFVALVARAGTAR
jgi:signal transduction histidine kinase/ActR/RegA family two-component response regulator